uniref:Uncharacterized protein n=1 Tax=Romanomermis culicivorax TaxID=13658 RepID=A0A915JTL3_ROMCU
MVENFKFSYIWDYLLRPTLDGQSCPAKVGSLKICFFTTQSEDELKPTDRPYNILPRRLKLY